MEEKEIRSKRGKKSRAAGSRFELRVRGDLENLGWTIDRWTNNVDLEQRKLVKCKPKFNPFTKSLMMNTAGFPDFVGIKRKGMDYDVIGIEAKGNGWLDKEEKEKVKFLLEKRIFSKVLIARKSKERGKIVYVDFAEKYNKT